jgi:hypothetical protein
VGLHRALACRCDRGGGDDDDDDDGGDDVITRVVQVELEGRTGVLEEATVLSVGFKPEPAPGADKEAQEKHKRDWEGKDYFGDAVVLSLHADPATPVVYPRTHVIPLAATSPAFAKCVAEELQEDLIPAFAALLGANVARRGPVYLPKKTIVEGEEKEETPPETPVTFAHAALLTVHLMGVRALHALMEGGSSLIKPAAGALTEQLVKTALKLQTGKKEKPRVVPLMIETTHPYNNNEDRTEIIHFPGASKLTIVFDEQSKTEDGCDWVKFFLDDAQTNQAGQTYVGSTFPGKGGKEPLEIEGERCILRWHSDHSNTDWGWKVIITPTFGAAGGRALTAREANFKALFASLCLCDGVRAPEPPTGLDTFPVAPTATAGGVGPEEDFSATMVKV